jgi:hypothetical protein
MAVKLLGYNVIKSATWLEIYDNLIPRAWVAGATVPQITSKRNLRFITYIPFSASICRVE